MKKSLLFLYLFCLNFFITSCNILDVEPTTSWTGTNIPTEESHLTGMLYGGYERFQTALSINFLVYGEMRSDVFYNNAFNANIDKVVNNKLDNGMSLASWRTFYEAIKQANLVLNYTPELLASNQITQENANNLTGQALTLRAYVYFYIIRIWGDAPLILTPFLSNEDLRDLSRTSTEQILEQIHLDLDEGATLIPPSATNRTSFSQTAAYALNAHVYAWEHNYPKVIEYTDKVLANNNYSLAPLYDPSIDVSDRDFKERVQSSEFAAIFNVGKSRESIFELAFSLQDGDNNRFLSSYLSGNYPIVRPYPEYAESFDDADWRAVVAHERASNGIYKAIKFTIGFSSDVDTRNIVLLRLGDIYLLKAEAIAHLGDSDENRINAMELVNIIRNRAGGEEFEIPETIFLDRENYNYENFKNIILEERKFELTYEGYRWFDLVRWGQAIEVVKEHVEIDIHPLSLVWPIHIEEIRRGKGIEQNEYYK